MSRPRVMVARVSEPEVDHFLAAFGAPAQLAVVVAQRDAVGFDHDRAFAALLGTVDGAWTGGLAAAGRFGDAAPSPARWSAQGRANGRRRPGRAGAAARQGQG